jgi:3-dehydroquinate dehydratase / shikimate dehydrogenase
VNLLHNRAVVVVLINASEISSKVEMRRIAACARSMSTATIVAVLDTIPTTGEALAALAEGAQRLEVRADLVGDPDAAWLRNHFRGELVYTRRTRGEGGTADRDPSRPARLKRAARDYDFVTLERGDLTPALLGAVPERKRIIAAHWNNAAADDLGSALAYLSATPARLYHLTCSAHCSGDELALMKVLHRAGRADVCAYATGMAGLWTRIVSPWLGAPVVFGRAGADDGPDGLPTVERLIESFGFPDLPPIDELFGMAGSPVLHSLSPRIHNTAFRAIGQRALYVPFHVDTFGDFWQNLVMSNALDTLGLPLRGLSVVSPHKAVAVGAVASKSAIVKLAASANFVRRPDGVWTAETTDADGVLLTLRDRGVQCRNKRVAVVGCGGSGRAMAAALHQAGADVTLVNRGLDRGSLAVRLLHLPFVPLRGFSPEPFSIVVNATPVGRDSDELPFPIERLGRDAVVVDLVYREQPTQLITRTCGPARITVDGWDMLVTQAARQFDLMTGREMPDGLARQTLGLTQPAAAGAEY